MEKDIIIDFQQPADGYGFVKILEDIPKKSRLVITVENFYEGNHPFFGLYTNIPLLKRKTRQDENGTVWYHVQTYKMKKDEDNIFAFYMGLPPQRYRKLARPIQNQAVIEWKLFSERKDEPAKWFTKMGIVFLLL